jgi:salicylate hydroxylase
LYPVHSKRYLNVVVCIKSKTRDLTNHPLGDRDKLLKRTRLWSRNLRALFALSDDWSIWPILERQRASFWEGGPVAIVGDASHAMTPFAAQGAAMAIEDAEVLAKAIEAGGLNPDSIEAYGKAREKRIAKVRKLAKTNGQLYHMGWPFSVFRNIGMELMPKSRLLTRQSWIYDWRA